MGGVILDFNLKKTVEQEFAPEYHDVIYEHVFGENSVWKTLDEGIYTFDQVIPGILEKLPEELMEIHLIGQVFGDPLVALVAALDAHHDHILVPVVQEILQAPALAVGGVLVEIEVVAVEEIHHRVALFAMVIAVGQPDVERAVLPGGGGVEIPFDDHGVPPEYFKLI